MTETFTTEMINSIETTIAIAFFGSIAIVIDKAIFLLIDKLLLLLTEFSNYCYCYWFYWLKNFLPYVVQLLKKLLLLLHLGTIAIGIAIAKRSLWTIAIGIAIAKGPLQTIAIAIEPNFYYWSSLQQVYYVTMLDYNRTIKVEGKAYFSCQKSKEK